VNPVFGKSDYCAYCMINIREMENQKISIEDTLIFNKFRDLIQ